MASDTKATSHKEDLPEKETPESAPESPLLDLSDAAVNACEGPLYEGTDKRPRKFAVTLDPAAYVQLREELTKLRDNLFNVALANR